MRCLYYADSPCLVVMNITPLFCVSGRICRWMQTMATYNCSFCLNEILAWEQCPSFGHTQGRCKKADAMARISWWQWLWRPPSASPALHQPFCFPQRRPSVHLCICRLLSSWDCSASLLRKLGGMLLPARERANHFFPCFAASSLAYCFGEVHNHGDYSEDMYIYLCFMTPTIFPDPFPSPQTGLRYIWASFMPSWNWIANSYSNENTYAAAQWYTTPHSNYSCALINLNWRVLSLNCW